MEQYQQVNAKYNGTNEQYLICSNARLPVHDEVIKKQVKGNNEKK